MKKWLHIYWRLHVIYWNNHKFHFKLATPERKKDQRLSLFFNIVSGLVVILVHFHMKTWRSTFDLFDAKNIITPLSYSPNTLLWPIHKFVGVCFRYPSWPLWNDCWTLIHVYSVCVATGDVYSSWTHWVFPDCPYCLEWGTYSRFYCVEWTIDLRMMDWLWFPYSYFAWMYAWYFKQKLFLWIYRYCSGFKKWIIMPFPLHWRV